MPKILPRNRTLRIAVVCAALFVFLGLSYLGAWYIARPMYKNWRERRANEVARDFMQKNDYTNALLAVRKTLGYNKMNVDAWKLAVEIMEKQKAPDVVFYQDNLANVEPTFENRLKLVQLAVKYRAYAQAEKTISKVGAEGAKSAEFLDLAAQVSRHTGNATRAKYYLMSLISLQPENNKARFELAQLRLIEGVAENKPSIRAEIRNLATDPEIRARALALLLSDSLQSQNSSEALELADQLADLANVPPPNYVLVADAYHRFAPTRFKAYLTKIEAEFGTEPEKTALLSNYLIGNDQAAETRRWIDTLDEKVRAAESVQVAYAYALLLLKDFNALETFLKAGKWGENEYARYVLLAYKYRATGQERQFNEAWKLAVIEVGNNLRHLQGLLAQTISWGWQDQKFELLWKRFMLEPSNQAIRNQLIVWERGRGNTNGLNRLFSRIIELDPGDKDSKNNYAYTSLLLGINSDRAYRSAAEDWQAAPQNAYYATTQALALYRQGKYAEALQIMDGLGISAITVPERALLQCALLIANGRFEDGANIAISLRRDGFLPEERIIFDEALAKIQKSHRDEGNVAKLAAMTASNPGAENRKSFLRELPAALRESPTVQMELADSLYSNDDYKGLEASLRNDKWGEREFLRLALLAYAQRQQGNAVGESRGTWRGAVASGGTSPANIAVLAELARRWEWNQEYIEILNRIFQRDPSDEKAFGELNDYYAKSNQTGDLARIYQQRLEANSNDSETKSRFAYYSLLTNSNVTRAYLLAKQAYDESPENAFQAKVYAFALYKQSRSPDGSQILEKFGDQKEKGPLQISLVKAALAAQQNQFQVAKGLLANFDSSSALPEETALAESLTKTIDAQGS